jgi:hypothetical protein
MSIWHKLLAAENQRFCSCRQTVLGESLNCSQTLQGLFHMSSVISLNIYTTSNSLMPISEHFSPYFNVVHIMHYIHINFLPTKQPLMPILYITRYITSSCSLSCTSAPSSGSLMFTVRFSAQKLAVNTVQTYW